MDGCADGTPFGPMGPWGRGSGKWEGGREEGREEIIYSQISWNCGRVVEVVCKTQYYFWRCIPYIPAHTVHAPTYIHACIHTVHKRGYWQMLECLPVVQNPPDFQGHLEFLVYHLSQEHPEGWKMNITCVECSKESFTGCAEKSWDISWWCWPHSCAINTVIMLVSHGHTNAWLPSNGNAWYSVIIRAYSTQVLEPSPAGPAMVGPPLADLIINFKPQFWCLYKEKERHFLVCGPSGGKTVLIVCGLTPRCRNQCREAETSVCVSMKLPSWWLKMMASMCDIVWPPKIWIWHPYRVEADFYKWWAHVASFKVSLGMRLGHLENHVLNFFTLRQWSKLPFL